MRRPRPLRSQRGGGPGDVMADRPGSVACADGQIAPAAVAVSQSAASASVISSTCLFSFHKSS